jgi:hypothetical protein
MATPCHTPMVLTLVSCLQVFHGEVERRVVVLEFVVAKRDVDFERAEAGAHGVASRSGRVDGWGRGGAEAGVAL